MNNQILGPPPSPASRANRFLYRDTDGVTLRRTLDDLSQRMLLVGGTAGLIWGGVAFLALLLGWMWIDVILDLPPSLRLIAWLTALVGLGWLSLRLILQTQQRSQAAVLAERLDAVAVTGGQIRSGLDLSVGKMTEATTTSDLTRGLAQLAVQKAGTLAAEVPEDSAVPAKPLAQSLMGIGGLGVAILLLVALLPRMAQTELLRFVDPFGDHPAYSRYDFVVTPDDLEVLYGESLDLAIDLRGPAVEQLELVMIPPERLRSGPPETAEAIDVLPAFPSLSGTWHASIANITEEFDLYVRVRRARSRTYPVKVITVPRINEIRTEIVPPLYTGLTAYHGAVGVNGVSGLPGTQVRVFATSNRLLSEGSLTLQSESETQTLVMASELDPHQVAAEFIIKESGHFDLNVVDEAGQPSTESFSAPIHVLEDQHPVVRMQQPRAVSLATPSANLPVVIAAEDDYGLRSCQLFRSLNDSRFLPTTLELPEGTPRRVVQRSELPLSAYGLKPGDEIKLFARVEDNDPLGSEEGQGKGTESSIVTVRIVSEEALRLMQQRQAGMEMLMSKYQQAQRRMENIAEQIEELQEELRKQPEDSPLAEEMRNKLNELAEQMQAEAEMLQKLSEMELPLDIDAQLSPRLQEMAQMLQKLSEQAKNSAGAPDMTPQQMQEQLQQLLDEVREQRKEHQEQTLQPLEHLRQVLPLKQDEAAFVQLVQRQRDLAERLSSLKDFEGQDDPGRKARSRELEEEQQRIRDELTDLLDKIEEHAASLPEDERLDDLRETAQEFVRAVRESEATDEMLNAESALARFSGSRGHAAANRAADILEQFLSQCQSMGGQAGECLPKFSPGLGSSLQQTLQQLVPGMGSQMGGAGLGQGGSGGYSSRSNTMQNVGMYGGLPLLTPGASNSGSSDSDNMIGTLPGQFASEQGDDGTEFQSRQSHPAYGGAEWGVPLRYRRQTGRYLRRLAEELEE